MPLETLAAIREATSSGPPGPSDRVREDELRVVGLVARQHGLGFRHDAIVRSLRAYGDGLRGIAEAEAEWWRSEVLEPLHAEGASTDEVTRRSAEISPDLSRDTDAALVALYHAQQMSVWMTNLVEGILAGLDAAGLYRRPRAFPAVAFVDLTGYTELTERRGDVDASGIIERFGQVVRAVLGQNGGRPVKWLGDGVMLHFPDRGRAVPIAVGLMNAVSSAGLPPARVGIHCGPVVLRQGDLYGHTVNVAARVAAYARSGELLLTRSMADIVDRTRFGTRSIGPIELKGLREPLELFTVEAHPGS